MGKLRKYRDIHEWKKLNLSLLPYRISRTSYFKRVKRMIELGLATENGKNLSLRKPDKAIVQPNEKFVRVINDKKVHSRIIVEILKRKSKHQEYHFPQKETSPKSIKRTFDVLTEIGGDVKSRNVVPDYTTNFSCIGIAKMFGYSSSYSGWTILNKLKEAGFIAIYKRYVPIEDTYHSPNWKQRKLSKPILVVNGKQVNPIASEIEIKMSRCKRGEAGLNNPKFAVQFWLNDLYGDTWG